MLIGSIVRFTLGIKNHRLVSDKLTGSELRIDIEAKARRKLPCSVCGRRAQVKDKLKERSWRGMFLCGISRSKFITAACQNRFS